MDLKLGYLEMDGLKAGSGFPEGRSGGYKAKAERHP